MTRPSKVLLGEVCFINPRFNRLQCPDAETLFSFVPMAAVDEVDGAIVAPEVRPYRSVAKGYTAFRNGDVLFAKITPCMENGKAVVAENLVGGLGFGSTEFHVLRPGSRLDRNFLFHFIRLPEFRRQAKAQFTGTAGQQRVPAAFLENFSIPLPSLEEQRRVVDILDRVASIRTLRRQAQETARQIIPALFNKMFGNPDLNPMGWPVRSLGTLLCEPPRNGLSPSRTGTYSDKVLTLSAITRGSFDTTAVKGASFARLVLQRERVSALDFLVTRGNGNLDLVGRGAFPVCSMPQVAFPDTIIAVRPNQEEISPEYFAAFWNTAYIRQFLAAKAQTTNGTFKLNQTAIVSAPIMLPPLAAQRAFAQLTLTSARMDLLQSRTKILSQAVAAAVEARMFAI